MGFSSMIEDILERNNESLGMTSIRVEGSSRIHKPYVPKLQSRVPLPRRPATPSGPSVEANPRTTESVKRIHVDHRQRISKLEMALKESRQYGDFLERKLSEENRKHLQHLDELRLLRIENSRLRDLNPAG